MKKKLTAMLLSVVLTASLLSGCSSKTPEGAAPAADENTAQEEAAGEKNTADSTEEETADPATVTGEFTYWTFTDSANNLIKAFNEVYPNVKIDLQVFGGDEYKTKILTALQSGSGVPDVFDLEEGYMYEFIESDLVADLSYIGIEDLTKDFYSFQVAQMKDSKGSFKTLLFQSSPVAFWYLRDAAEEWLGTSDPAEISAMLSDWDTIIARGEEINEKSGGKVSLWPNIAELVKVDAYSFKPLVRDGKLAVGDEWIGMLDDMRTMSSSKATVDLNSWSSEWAAAWNEGTLLLRVMPSWDFFTDWEMNKGNVGVAAPFKGSYEGGTGTCVYNNSEQKEAAGVFLKFIASDEFQKINMERHNQVPASKKITDEMSQGFTAPDYGGQNLLATYSEICANVSEITPDKYTRPSQNEFQKCATDGIKAGKDNEAIIAEFKEVMKDKYPELIID